MYKIFKRVCAYLIDILIIMTLTQCLSSTTIFNPNLNKYQKYNQQYLDSYTEYANTITNLEKYYQDNKLTEKEYNKLIKLSSKYTDTINKYYQDNKLTKKNHDKLVKEISNSFQKESSKTYYLVEKNSISEKVIYLILVILYFIGFNYITNGQTLGKKLMRIRIKSTTKENKVSLVSYLIRVVLMYQTIYYIVRLIAILFVSSNDYTNITNIAYSIQNILDLLIISCILLRKDGRGLHDILAKTKVIGIDRKGIEEQ